MSVLLMAGIRDILIISTPEDQAGFQRLLGVGRALAAALPMPFREVPNGLAQAFVIGADLLERIQWLWYWATIFFTAADFGRS